MGWTYAQKYADILLDYAEFLNKHPESLEFLLEGNYDESVKIFIEYKETEKRKEVEEFKRKYW